ncbi:MAG: 6-pyruvoyl trahydropterin synthase family protein [Gemmatimonadaceae bacterium]
MPTASLTRRIAFSAAHRYSRPDWSDEKNVRTFGACAWPNYHGHTYVCDVTVSGPIDDVTGFVVDLGVLDDILRKEVGERFDHRNINLDVPEFADGKLVPTGENLARFIFDKVSKRLPKPATVIRVTVGEDDSLSATYSRE